MIFGCAGNGKKMGTRIGGTRIWGTRIVRIRRVFADINSQCALLGNEVFKKRIGRPVSRSANSFFEKKNLAQSFTSRRLSSSRILAADS